MKPIECQSFFVLLAQLVTLKAEVLQAAAEDGDWERPMSRLSLFLQNDSQRTGLIKSDLSSWISLDLLNLQSLWMDLLTSESSRGMVALGDAEQAPASSAKATSECCVFLNTQTCSSYRFCMGNGS
jgi:hypothetical protein